MSMRRTAQAIISMRLFLCYSIAGAISDNIYSASVLLIRGRRIHTRCVPVGYIAVCRKRKSLSIEKLFKIYCSRVNRKFQLYNFNSMGEGSTLKQRGIRNILSDSMKPDGTLRHCLFVLLFFSLFFTIFFSPVIFHNSLLAPAAGVGLGDAVVSHLPFYLSEKLSWDPLLSCGFPMIADPQAMSWYPPALLLSLIPGTWNIFVISAYVMAACFAYGYVYTLTESRAAALTGGISYSMCGFMFAHMGHTAMIHSAVWLPLIIWSLEMLRRKVSRFWFAIACVAVASCVFAGHLQIVVYSLVVSSAYALVMGWSAPIGRNRFYLLTALLLILGLGLSAIQILPTAELASFSMRTNYAFSDFVSYSLPFKQLPLLVFPASFGGLAHYGTTPYFGEWNLIEMTGYVGL